MIGMGFRVSWEINLKEKGRTRTLHGQDTKYCVSFLFNILQRHSVTTTLIWEKNCSVKPFRNFIWFKRRCIEHGNVKRIYAYLLLQVSAIFVMSVYISSRNPNILDKEWVTIDFSPNSRLTYTILWLVDQ
jgi:hypothetical protein